MGSFSFEFKHLKKRHLNPPWKPLDFVTVLTLCIVDLLHPTQVTCGRDKLRQLESRLKQALHLYKRRLEWLTTESRRVFGVIEERAVTIVLDIRNMSPQQFDLYRMALERVIYEQITQIAKFNLIRYNSSKWASCMCVKCRRRLACAIYTKNDTFCFYENFV